MSVRLALDADLRCSVCDNIYEHPYLLQPCRHRYCLKCIQKLGNTKVCPQCRCQTDISCAQQDPLTQSFIAFYYAHKSWPNQDRHSLMKDCKKNSETVKDGKGEIGSLKCHQVSPISGMESTITNEELQLQKVNKKILDLQLQKAELTLKHEAMVTTVRKLARELVKSIKEKEEKMIQEIWDTDRMLKEKVDQSQSALTKIKDSIQGSMSDDWKKVNTDPDSKARHKGTYEGETKQFLAENKVAEFDELIEDVPCEFKSPITSIRLGDWDVDRVICVEREAKEDSPNEDHSQHHENDVEELLNEAVLVEGPVEPEVNILNIGGVENTGGEEPNEDEEWTQISEDDYNGHSSSFEEMSHPQDNCDTDLSFEDVCHSEANSEEVVNDQEDSGAVELDMDDYYNWGDDVESDEDNGKETKSQTSVARLHHLPVSERKLMEFYLRPNQNSDSTLEEEEPVLIKFYKHGPQTFDIINAIKHRCHKLHIINNYLLCDGGSCLFVYNLNCQLVNMLVLSQTGHCCVSSLTGMEGKAVIIAFTGDQGIHVQGIHIFDPVSTSMSIVTTMGSYADVTFHNGCLYALNMKQSQVVLFKTVGVQWLTEDVFNLLHPNVCEYDKVCVTPADFLLISSCFNNTFYIYGKSGCLLHKFGTYGVFEPGQFQWPILCGVDNTGNILVADCLNNRLQVYDTSEDQWNVVQLHIPHPRHVVFDHSGQCFVLTSNTLVKIGCCDSDAQKV